MYMSHSVLQTSRRSWALDISQNSHYSAGSPGPSKERRMDGKNGDKGGEKMLQGRTLYMCTQSILFRSCLHRWSQYFQEHQLLGFCSAPGEAWEERKLGLILKYHDMSNTSCFTVAIELKWCYCYTICTVKSTLMNTYPNWCHKIADCTFHRPSAILVHKQHTAVPAIYMRDLIRWDRK